MSRRLLDNPYDCPQCLRHETNVKRLQKTIARLTKSVAGKSAKQIYFDEKDLAVRLGLSVKTLQNWRGKGIGPRWYRFGRVVRYRLRDIQAYERSLPSGGGNFE